MNSDATRILAKMKKLIYEGKRRFSIRKDRDYLEELLNVGVSEEEAWREILLLKPINFFLDRLPFYYKDGKSLIFKKEVNNTMTYIKLRLENNEEDEVVCISFHRDEGEN